jgi:hypothetical protein
MRPEPRSPSARTPEAPALPPISPAEWSAMAAAAAAEFRERLAASHVLRLGERDQERFARRMREVLDSALQVPSGLEARIAAEVGELYGDASGADVVEIAWRGVRERARQAAAIGAVTTLPAMVPGLGTALATLGLVADFRYVSEQQRDLVLEVAALFRAPPEDPTARVRALFIHGLGEALGTRGEGEAGRRSLAEQMARRSVARVVPGAGAVVGSALNFLATTAIGRAAIVYFGERAGIDVSRVFPAPRHAAMPYLEQAVVAAVKTAMLGDGEAAPFTAEQRATLAELAACEREELLDLAIVSAVSQGGVSAEEEVLLRHLAELLGFPPDALEPALQDARDEVVSVGIRFRELLDSARDTPSGVTRLVWRRTRELARG